MPFAHGDTLATRIDKEGALPLDEALHITREIAAAIDHAHANGIIHRDIKPQNVVFDDSRALICDFGVARALATAGGERLSSSGVIVGTPEYMSPEQATGILDIGQAADIYALGCLVYTILAGEPPFSGPTTQAVLARHVKAPVPTLNIVRHDVPQAVQRAVERALAKNPQDRPATAGEMVREMSA
jgi:serine/threonine protein kinase